MSFLIETPPNQHYQKDEYILNVYRGEYTVESSTFAPPQGMQLVCVIKKHNQLRDIALVLEAQNELTEILKEKGTRVWLLIPAGQNVLGRGFL